MECRGPVNFVSYPDGVWATPGEYLYTRAGASYHRSPNKNCFEGAGIQNTGMADLYVALQLPSVSISSYPDVHQSQTDLTGVLYVARQQNRSGTGSKDRVLPPEIQQGLGKIFVLQEFQQRRAFTAGDDQSFAGKELLPVAHLDGLGACLLKRARVGFKVSLET